MKEIISKGIKDLLVLDPSLEVKETLDVNDVKCIAIVIRDMEIVDPYRSECGRFDAYPHANYGLSAEVANKLVEINMAIFDKDRTSVKQRPS